MLGVPDMRGLWNRSLLVRADGTRDTTTFVAWLQGPTLFVDLRQAAGRPSFAGVRSLGDLNGEQLAWLAEQEGFAGRLKMDGEYFVWCRVLDFQPPSLVPDSGMLWLEGETMIEKGRHSPYIEHWHRDEDDIASCAALRMRDAADNTEGFLVRVGPHFMYARAGVSAFPAAGVRLADLLCEAPSLAAARELVDCEISIGRVSEDGWVIQRSSLPYREGASLDPQIGASEHRCSTADIGADGGTLRRSWEVMELEGDATALGEKSEHEAAIG